MGEVIYLPSAMRGNRLLNQQSGLTLNEVERLEAIRDNVEALLNMVAGIRRDPEAVAYAAARFGLMRMYYLHGRALMGQGYDCAVLCTGDSDTVRTARNVLNLFYYGGRYCARSPKPPRARIAGMLLRSG